MRTLWVLAGVVLAVAGCGTEEEAVDRDASASETDEVVEPGILDVVPGDDVPGPGCDTAVERLRAYVAANSSCETAADCATYVVRFSCDCGYQEAVRADSVAGAEALLQEVTDCGIEPEDIFQCTADGAPPVVLDCGLGKCYASVSESCLVYDSGPEQPDAVDTPDVSDVSDVSDVTVDDCTTVEARWNAYVESNNQCETAADCQIYVSREDCGCSYASSVNGAAVDGATALQAEAERCGLGPETVLGCVADAAPGMSLGCSGGRCRVGWPDSCLDYFDVGPDGPFEPDVWSEDDVVPPDADDGSGTGTP